MFLDLGREFGQLQRSFSGTASERNTPATIIHQRPPGFAPDRFATRGAAKYLTAAPESPQPSARVTCPQRFQRAAIAVG